jgi:hypothetical protein
VDILEKNSGKNMDVYVGDYPILYKAFVRYEPCQELLYLGFADFKREFNLTDFFINGTYDGKLCWRLSNIILMTQNQVKEHERLFNITLMTQIK